MSCATAEKCGSQLDRRLLEEAPRVAHGRNPTGQATTEPGEPNPVRAALLSAARACPGTHELEDGPQRGPESNGREPATGLTRWKVWEPFPNRAIRSGRYGVTAPDQYLLLRAEGDEAAAELLRIGTLEIGERAVCSVGFHPKSAPPPSFGLIGVRLGVRTRVPAQLVSGEKDGCVSSLVSSLGSVGPSTLQQAFGAPTIEASVFLFF